MAKGKGNLDSLNKRMGGGNPPSDSASHIGDAVYWGLSEMRITPADLTALFIKHNLNLVDIIPPDPKPEAVFRRAIHQAKVEAKRRGENGILIRGENGILIREIENTDDALVFGIVDEERVQSNGPATTGLFSKTLEHETVDRVCFYKNSEAVAYDNGHELSEWIVDRFNEEVGTISTSGILSMLRSAMDRFKAFPIRDRGGIYFVAADFSYKLEALRNIVSDLGGGCHLDVLNLYSTQASTKSLARSAKSALEDDLNSLKEELDKFSSGGARERTIEKRFETLSDLRERVGMYSAMLGFAKDEIEGGLKKAEEQIRKLLGA